MHDARVRPHYKGCSSPKVRRAVVEKPCSRDKRWKKGFLQDVLLPVMSVTVIMSLTPHQTHTHTSCVYSHQYNMQISALLCGPLTSPRGDLHLPGVGVGGMFRVSTPPPSLTLSLSFQFFGEIPTESKNCLWVAYAISWLVFVIARLLPV